MENNIKSIIFDQYTISKVGSTDWQKDDSAVHFWAALHFYSIADFVSYKHATLLKIALSFFIQSETVRFGEMGQMNLGYFQL